MNKQTVKQLQILHLALSFGPLVFAAFVVFAGIKPMHTNFIDTDRIFFGISVVFCVAAPMVSRNVFARSLQKAGNMNNLAEKLAVYRQAFIVKLAIIENAVFFCLVCAFVTGNYLCLALALPPWVFLAFQKPDATSIASELALSADEKSELED